MAFYRDGLGLPEIGRFEGHEGYDGVFLGVPGTESHLEFTSGGGHDTPHAHSETLLALYLGSTDAVDEALARVEIAPVQPTNPYWEGNGVTVADPDGFRVVLVPRAWSES